MFSVQQSGLVLPLGIQILSWLWGGLGAGRSQDTPDQVAVPRQGLQGESQRWEAPPALLEQVGEMGASG